MRQRVHVVLVLRVSVGQACAAKVTPLQRSVGLLATAVQSQQCQWVTASRAIVAADSTALQDGPRTQSSQRVSLLTTIDEVSGLFLVDQIASESLSPRLNRLGLEDTIHVATLLFVKNEDSVFTRRCGNKVDVLDRARIRNDLESDPIIGVGSLWLLRRWRRIVTRLVAVVVVVRPGASVGR